MTEPLIMSWSGGKDSAMALDTLLHDERYEVRALLTTVNAHYGRVSMHGYRRELLREQAESIGMPLIEVELPERTDNRSYEDVMAREMEKAKKSGVHTIAFADLFLADLREYREKNLAKAGMGAVFPLWMRDTAKLSREVIAMGFEAVLTCVDGEALGPEFCGRRYDLSLLNDLPPSVDPCGERGEFHSFVFAGPIFRRKIGFTLGDKVFRENRFHFQDLIPDKSTFETAGEIKKVAGMRG